MARRSKSSRRRTSAQIQPSAVVRDRSYKPAVSVKRTRPGRYSDIEIVRRDPHYPTRPRKLTFRRSLHPMYYDEAVLRHYSTPAEKPPPITRPKRWYVRRGTKVYDPVFCRRQKIRRTALFALGIAGAGSPLPRSVRRRRARKYRQTYHGRVKC